MTAKLVDALAAAARAAFSEVRAAHPDEHFYLYGFFSETGDDLQPASNSEEGLSRTATATKTSVDELRWFVDELAYLHVGESHFRAVQKISKTPGADGFAAGVAALQKLDREGFFGRGRARGAVTVLILMSDQSNRSVMELAAQLNPPSVVRRLAPLFPVRAAVSHAGTIGDERVYGLDAIQVDGNIVAASATSDGLFAWDVSRKKPRQIFRQKVDGIAWELALCDRVIFGRYDKGVRRWQIETGKELPPVAPALKDVGTMAVAPDGKRLALSSSRRARKMEEGVVELIAVTTGERLAQREGEPSAMAFSPDGKVLALVGIGKGIRLWDAVTLAPLRSIGSKLEHGFVCFSSDGKRLAAAQGREGVAEVWNAGKLAGTFGAPDESFTVIALSSDGKRLAGAGGERFACWDVESGECLLDASGRHENFTALAFMPGETRLAVGGTDVDEGPPIYLWDLPE